MCVYVCMYTYYCALCMAPTQYNIRGIELYCIVLSCAVLSCVVLSVLSCIVLHRPHPYLFVHSHASIGNAIDPPDRQDRRV